MKRRKETHAGDALMDFYDRLYSAFGAQGWWPARTRFEMIVGAILTQNTAWSNVEKAIASLRSARMITPKSMHAAAVEDLAGHIRSAGYFNVKAARLKNFTTHLFERHGGSLSRLLASSSGDLREELLGINGIGPETADSILLYAAGRAEFVVDAYTRRMMARHGLIEASAGYDETKALFTRNLAPDAALFNEYHALIVRAGKEFCRTREPLCKSCPLGPCL